MLESQRISQLIEEGNQGREGGIAVIPEPDLDILRTSGAASIDLRLGRWFVTLRQSRNHLMELTSQHDQKEDQAARDSRRYFVRFGEKFILHPGRFVLGATLEWIKVPKKLSGYVTGKSGWARRGIVIETAAGIHPGFSGCLTLEIANIGEVPVAISPGMQICQIFFSELQQEALASDSPFAGRRRPHLGIVKSDPVLQRLKMGSSN